MYASLEKHEDLRRQLVSTVRTMVANTLSEEPYNTEQHRAYADSGSRERGATPWARATQGRRCGDDHRHISRGAGENRESARKMRALLERTMLTGTTCTRHSNAGGVRRPVRRGCRVPPTRSSQPHRACVGHDCRRRQTRCPRRTLDGSASAARTNAPPETVLTLLHAARTSPSVTGIHFHRPRSSSRRRRPKTARSTSAPRFPSRSCRFNAANSSNRPWEQQLNPDFPANHSSTRGLPGSLR